MFQKGKLRLNIGLKTLHNNDYRGLAFHYEKWNGDPRIGVVGMKALVGPELPRD